MYISGEKHTLQNNDSSSEINSYKQKVLDILSEKNYQLQQVNSNYSTINIFDQYQLRQTDYSYELKGINIKNNMLVSIKISKNGSEQYQMMVKEAEVLQKLQISQLFVEVIERIDVQKDFLFILITEYCESTLISHLNYEISMDRLVQIIFDLINSLVDIHSQNISHWNINSSNIFLTANGKYKLGFNNIQILPNQTQLSQTSDQQNKSCLTKTKESDNYYIPSEFQDKYMHEKMLDEINIIQQPIYIQQKSDIYCLGIVFFEMIGLKLNDETLHLIKEENYQELLKLIDLKYQNIYTFIRSYMVRQKQKLRYPALILRRLFIYYYEQRFINLDFETQRINSCIEMYKSMNLQDKFLAYKYCCLSQQNPKSENDEQLKQALKIIQNLSCEISEDRAIFLQDLSIIQYNKQKFQECQESLDILMIICNQLEIIPLYTFSLTWISFLLIKLNELQKGEYYLKKLEQALEYHPKDHPQVSNYYKNYSFFCTNSGFHEQALEYDQKQFALNQELYNQNHPEIMKSIRSLALSYQDFKQYQTSLEYYQKALDVALKLYPNNHKDTSILFRDISYCYYVLNQFDKALEYDLKTLEMRESLFSSNHILVADCLLDLGITYFKLKNFSEALKTRLRRLQILQNLNLFENISYFQELIRIGDLYFYHLSNNLMSIKYYKEAFNTSIKYPKLKISNQNEILIFICDIYKNLDDREEAEFYKYLSYKFA